MTNEQINAFKTASGLEPTLLNSLFIGALIALLVTWTGWALVHAYRGYAANKLSEQIISRFMIRVVLLLVVTLFLFVS